MNIGDIYYTVSHDHHRNDCTIECVQIVEIYERSCKVDIIDPPSEIPAGAFIPHPLLYPTMTEAKLRAVKYLRAIIADVENNIGKIETLNL